MHRNRQSDPAANQVDMPIMLEDYWRILVRRRFHFLLPFMIVMACALSLAFFLPPTYRSQATFLIERATIPSGIVATTVVGYVQEQIQQIRERLMASDSLISLAEEFGLYSQEMQDDRRAAITTIRESIEIAMVDVRASDPDVGGQRQATIAFTVAFEGPSPELAKSVTEELGNRYIEINRQIRAERAEGVTTFLAAESEKLVQEIAEIESRLADFKQGEMRQLPELMNLNLNLFERTDQQIQQSEERIRGLQSEISAISSELSLTDPYEEVLTEDGSVMLTGAQRLSVLTAEYLQLSARYSARHPDVIKLSREIRVLAEQAGSGARADELINELVRYQEQLRIAQQQYSDEHPEVLRLERSIAALQRGFQTALVSADSAASTMTSPPNNPRYVALKTQLDSAESNLTAEKARLRELNEKLAEYEERLYQTPIVERDFISLSRDYDNTIAKYRDLKEKELQAELAQQLETGEKAERFVLASAAYYPTSPESPNQLGIILLGGLLGLACGIGAVAIKEYLDKTLRDASMLTRILGTPPLAVIPKFPSS